MEFFNKKHQIITIILLFIIILISIIFSLFKIIKTYKDNNIVQKGCLNIIYKSGKQNIELLNTKPIADKEGILTEPFLLDIENTCLLKIKYQINIEELEETNINNNNIKISLNNDQPILKSNLVFKEEEINPGEIKEYNIKMWINDNTDLISKKNNIYKGKITINTNK